MREKRELGCQGVRGSKRYGIRKESNRMLSGSEGFKEIGYQERVKQDVVTECSVIESSAPV